jgi:hypothetical protein
METAREAPDAAGPPSHSVGEVSVVMPPTQPELNTPVATVLLRLLRAMAESDTNGSGRSRVA